MEVTAEIAALLVAVRKPWNCTVPGPRIPSKLHPALAAYGIAKAAMVAGRTAAF
jgi:hypothetical protein